MPSHSHMQINLRTHLKSCTSKCCHSLPTTQHRPITRKNTTGNLGNWSLSFSADFSNRVFGFFWFPSFRSENPEVFPRIHGPKPTIRWILLVRGQTGTCLVRYYIKTTAPYNCCQLYWEKVLFGKLHDKKGKDRPYFFLGGISRRKEHVRSFPFSDEAFVGTLWFPCWVRVC